jgi:hypothetical protein
MPPAFQNIIMAKKPPATTRAIMLGHITTSTLEGAHCDQLFLFIDIRFDSVNRRRVHSAADFFIITTCIISCTRSYFV